MKKQKPPKDKFVGEFFIDISKLFDEKAKMAFGQNPKETLNMLIILWLSETDNLNRQTIHPSSLAPEVFKNIVSKLKVVAEKHYERGSHENEFEKVAKDFLAYKEVFNRPKVLDTKTPVVDENTKGNEQPIQELAEWQEDIFYLIRDAFIVGNKFYAQRFGHTLGEIRTKIQFGAYTVGEIVMLTDQARYNRQF